MVLGSEAEAIQARVDLHGARPVFCPGWKRGTFASLMCGLRALEGTEDEVVVALGDQPALTAERIDAVRAVEGPIVRAFANGGPSHPVVIRKGSELAPGNLRQARGVELGLLADIDTPEDLSAS